MIRRTYSQTENNIILSALNVSVARMCCFNQVSLVKKPVDSATLSQDITKCDVDLRKSLYANVVLSCGTNLFQGMVERMSFELTEFVPSTMRSKWLLHRDHHLCRRYTFPLRRSGFLFFFIQVSMLCRQVARPCSKSLFFVTEPTLYPPCTLYP